MGIEGYVIQPAAAEGEDVLSAYVEGVFRHEGYVIAIVIGIVSQLVVGEGGVGVSVVGGKTEGVGQLGTDAYFASDATALSGVDGDTAESALRELGNLLVMGVHEESGKVGLQLSVEEGQVRADFVVPRVFGFIKGRGTDGCVGGFRHGL